MRLAVPVVRLNVDAAVGRLRELLKRTPAPIDWRARALEAERELAAERLRSRLVEREAARAVAYVVATLAWLQTVLAGPAANEDAYAADDPPRSDGP